VVICIVALARLAVVMSMPGAKASIE
jgi:hypothetical protein